MTVFNLQLICWKKCSVISYDNIKQWLIDCVFTSLFLVIKWQICEGKLLKERNRLKQIDNRHLVVSIFSLIITLISHCVYQEACLHCWQSDQTTIILLINKQWDYNYNLCIIINIMILFLSLVRSGAIDRH